MAWYNASTNSYEGSGTKGARNYESASSASSNSAATAISVVAAFTGTNTGNRYNVGQSYVMNGDAYTAQADGSFKNNRTGQSLGGSSDSNTVTFFAAPSLASQVSVSSGQTQPVSSGVSSPQVVASVTGDRSAMSSGPGNAGSITSQTGTGTGPGKPAAASAGSGRLKSPFGVTPGGGATRVTPNSTSVAPKSVFVDPGMPNVEDYWEPRYGEPGEWLGGIANILADGVGWVRDGGPVDFMVDRVDPTSPGVQINRTVEQAVENGFYLDQVQTFRDEAGWAPKW